MRNALPPADPAELPTRAEFGRRLTTDQRRMYWTLGICCTSIVLMFLGMVFGGEAMNRAGVPVGSTERLWPLYVMSPFPFGLLIGGIWWAERKSQTKCPACRQSLFTAHDPYVAMVTGRCPKCAAPMFADDVHDFDAQQTNRRAPPTARESLREVGEFLREFRPWIPWAIAGAVLLGLGIKAEQLIQTEYYRSLLGEVRAAFLRPLTLAPGVLVGSLGLWACVRALNKNAEECPACGETIGGWSRQTGNCTSCALAVVVDPFPGLQPRDAVAARLWTIDEYRTAASDRHSRLWIGCFIGAGLAAVWCGPLLIYLSQQPQYYVQSGREMAAYVVTLAGLGVFQCLGVWWWDRRLARGLHCPECDQELLHFYPLVISSQRCRHCGCQVLETPVVQPAA